MGKRTMKSISSLIAAAFVVLAFLTIADVVHPDMKLVGFLVCIIYARVILLEAKAGDEK